MKSTTYYNPKGKKIFDFFKKFGKGDKMSLSGVSKGSDTAKLSMSGGKEKWSSIKKLGTKSAPLLIVLGVIALFAFLFVVRPAYSVISVTKSLKKDVRDLEYALTIRDMVLFEDALDKAEEDLGRLGRARDSSFGWARNFPPTKSYYEDTDHFIAAGLHGVNAGREIIVLVEPFADAAGIKMSEEQEIDEDQGLAEAFSIWVSLMPQVAENMDGVIAELAEIGAVMKKVDASKYPKSLFGNPVRPVISATQSSLANIGDYGPDIKAALTIIPGLLGSGTSEQRYAIIMQNNAEIRATGGFWTNYSTFKVNNALLTSDFTSKDMYSVDFVLNQIDAWHTFPKVPPTYEKHLKVERMFARDANISPDFPTAIEQWMYFYNLGNQIAPWEIKPIAGVIAIDTDVVKELLEVTGPVTVSGVTFDENNVVLELEKIASLSLTEQVNRKKVLGDLMEGMLVNVFESDKNLWPRMIDKGVDLMLRKHILVNLFDLDAQVLLEKYNLSGRIADPVEGDYAYAVSTNLGGDKTNLFVTKEVTHELSKEDNRWMRTVKIDYTYNEAPPEYAPLVKRFRDWMRLYVPLGSELISLDGSMDEAGEGEERGKTYFHGYTEFGPGETGTMTFKYYLPDGVVGDEYTLLVQKQPGINTETHNVVVDGDRQTKEISTDHIFRSAL